MRVLIDCLDEHQSLTLAGDTQQHVMQDAGFTSWTEFFAHLRIEGTEVDTLQVSYRTSQEIGEFAAALLGKLREDDVPLITTRSGPPVEFFQHTDHGACIAALADALTELAGEEPLASVAVLTPSPSLSELYFSGLERSEVPRLHLVRNQDFRFAPGVEVTEIEQVKGLEFDYVILVGVERVALRRRADGAPASARGRDPRGPPALADQHRHSVEDRAGGDPRGRKAVRELRDILGAFQMLRKSGEAGVLASAVHTEGSTYRRSGARMLVLPDDRVIGLISGGCLEGDLLEHARSVRESGEPRIVRYDMRPEEDIIWGLGLGCAGVVDVLLERVDGEAPGPLDLLAECIRERKPGVIATALAGKAALATRWALHPDGRFSGPAAGAARDRARGPPRRRAGARCAVDGRSGEDPDRGGPAPAAAAGLRSRPRRRPGGAHRLRARLGGGRGGLAPRLCPPGELPGSERRRAV